jgi:hypothetical protein
MRSFHGYRSQCRREHLPCVICLRALVPLTATGWNPRVSETSEILDELAVWSGRVGADFSRNADWCDVVWPQQPT